MEALTLIVLPVCINVAINTMQVNPRPSVWQVFKGYKSPAVICK